jgi:hypothetical protein
MPRKTNGNTTTSRKKKTADSIPPAEVQVAPVVNREVNREVSKEVSREISKKVPTNGKPSNVVPINLNLNIEDQIRRRAYELYLERRATAGYDSGSGNENQDWLMAEREIRSRLGGQAQAFGAAAGQVRS